MANNRRQAFHDIARHRSTDMPYLVAAWQHLVGHEYGADEFADAYIDFVNQWDWDWVKINPRAIYYSEAWGSKYDENDYAGYVIPRKLQDAVTSVDDLAEIVELDPKTNEVFGQQYASAAKIRAAFTDRAVLQSIFNPLSVLLQLADVPLYPGDEYATPSLTRDELVFEHAEEAKKALTNIANTLAAYAAALVTPVEQGGAGLDGIFFALTGTVSEGYFTKEQYAEFGEPYDRIVLNAIKQANPDAEVLLHTCRAFSNPDWFDDYGVEIVQWDQYLDGNPQIDTPLKVVPVGGPSFTDFAQDGDDQIVKSDIDKVIKLREGKPFLLAPSCTVPTPASDQSLKALADARA
jgi:uroporphyrinogen decarboxylase